VRAASRNAGAGAGGPECFASDAHLRRGRSALRVARAWHDEIRAPRSVLSARTRHRIARFDDSGVIDAFEAR
jgi:hypothetical protein